MGGRFGHEIPLGDLTLVPRRDNQILAAGAAIRPGCSHVSHKTEPRVVDSAWATTRRDFDHGRAIAVEIQEEGEIDRIRVARQEERFGVKQLIEDDRLVGDLTSEFEHPLPHRLERGRWDAVEENLDGPHKGEVVVEQLCGLGSR